MLRSKGKEELFLLFGQLISHLDSVYVFHGDPNQQLLVLQGEFSAENIRSQLQKYWCIISNSVCSYLTFEISTVKFTLKEIKLKEVGR